MPTPSSPLLPDERLTAGAARLATRYAGHFSPEIVLGLLADSSTRLAEQARTRTHLFVLAERLTAERLDALAHTQGLASGPTRVLVVCSENAGRSPMAAALLAPRAGERVTVSSAGRHPPRRRGGTAHRPGTHRGRLDPRRCVPQAADRAPIAGVRGIRDAIDAHITELLTQLAP
ncbi:three-helix bundle dimerization domain-containing protein [Streptomyces katrae]|uniref:three-helix bundle dimerization domain-containing protein n=1 Tax=Streptomyces katrae TaxID=68223 RepID=UPI000AE74E8C|nr:arsenate reductase ArsC [Streptomyces katrae]